MIKFVEDTSKRVAREVVRITGEEKMDKSGGNNGKVASFILKALILDDKEVYLKFVSGGKNVKDLTFRVIRILAIANRMLNESLSTLCGGPDKVPSKYKGKQLRVFAGLPYDKNTPVSFIKKVGDKVVKEKAPGVVQKDGTVTDIVKSTIIPLYLAIEE